MLPDSISLFCRSSAMESWTWCFFEGRKVRPSLQWWLGMASAGGAIQPSGVGFLGGRWANPHHLVGVYSWIPTLELCEGQRSWVIFFPVRSSEFSAPTHDHRSQQLPWCVTSLGHFVFTDEQNNKKTLSSRPKRPCKGKKPLENSMFFLNPKLWDTILTVVTTAFSTAMAPWQGTFFAADLAGVSQMAMDSDEKAATQKCSIFFLVFFKCGWFWRV